MVSVLDRALKRGEVVGSIPDAYFFTIYFRTLDPFSLSKESGWIMGNWVKPFDPVQI